MNVLGAFIGAGLLCLMQACAVTGAFAPADPKSCAGSWLAEWYDGGVDRGIGTVRIASDGSIDGVLRDDGYDSSEWNQAVGAFLKGRVSRDGSFQGSVSWSSGRAGWKLVGSLSSDPSGALRLQAAPPGGEGDAMRALTVTLRRSDPQRSVDR
jgi:hypothetical protein